MNEYVLSLFLLVLTFMHDSPDMFVIGVQEIVALTAQQIVQTDPDKRLGDHFLFERMVRLMFFYDADAYGKTRLWTPLIVVLIRREIMSYSGVNR